MAFIQKRVLSVLFLFLLYEGGVVESERKLTFSINDYYCQGSPLDFIHDLIGGPATLFLPEAVLNITLSVEIQYSARNGIKILKLHPVMVDEEKCVNYPVDPIRLCYEYSEIHWGKTDEEGSDHSIQGYSYPMEIQHYFHRTDFVNRLTPVAVAVLFDIKSRSSQIDTGTFESTYNDHHVQHYFKKIYEEMDPTVEVPEPEVLEPEILEPEVLEPEVIKPTSLLAEELEHMPLHQKLNFKDQKNLKLGDWLPKDIKSSRFYQYRGTVSGSCGEERDWIVFEDTLDVPYTFLNFLRSLGNERDDHHFQEIQGYDRCVLYSHYTPVISFETTLETTCKISGPVRVTKPLITEGLLEGNPRKASIPSVQSSEDVVSASSSPSSSPLVHEDTKYKQSSESSEVVSVGPRVHKEEKSEPSQKLSPDENVLTSENSEEPKPIAEVKTTEEPLDDEKYSTIPDFSPVLSNPSDGNSHSGPLQLETFEEPELITAAETTTDATEDSSCVGKLRPGLFFLFLGILICFA